MFDRSRKAILNGIIERLEALESAPAPPSPPIPTASIIAELGARLEPQFDVLSTAVRELERRLEETRVAVAEGIERTERTERRIASTVARARKELRESGYDHPGVEAEAAGLRKVDGDGSDDGGVQPVQGAVEANADEPSSIRGVPASYLRRVRGFQ